MATPTQPLIRLRGVVKHYHTAGEDFPALKGIDLDVAPGEFVGIVGKSGAGKTTLINMVTGIDHLTAGEVWVEGTPVHRLDENRLSRWRGSRLGIVYQSFYLMPTLTLLQNVMLPMDFCHTFRSGERKARAAAAILRGARQMNTMIQDIVDSARLESGRLELHKDMVDLIDHLGEVVGRLGAADRERIRIEAPEWVQPVLADRDRLERVIVNLLTNALKYSAEAKPVVVRIIGQPGQAIIEVIDEGVGIAPEELPHLGQSFYRTQSGKHAGGTGLGLYISRLLVEAHGGHVEIESDLGRGTAVRVFLPLQTA